MEYGLIGILGLLIGSFLNVCIYRIPKEESISFPPSHCSNCNHRLGAKDLIPILSYIFLKGRCRYCNTNISARYPLIEFLNMALYLLIYLKFGLTLITIKYFLLASLLVVISMIDYDTQYIFTSTTVFGGVIGVVFLIIEVFIYKAEMKDYILGASMAFVIIGTIVFLTRGMGEGDIELASVCGLFLGVKGIILGLFLSIMIGGIVGAIVLLLKLKKAKEKIAFGPFIAMGTIVSLLYGAEIIKTYLSLFI
ncbi:prepilin peptidase [Clostridium sp. SHJSY1]|uniref:prepilin peptidase n=1 Tax=Clostridium sp. SHJSY1 TaxID=2942483 RepID=UPI0028748F5A|nr:prepilin peptidase [Clostridium sp. SHJSY1]MDS0525693.1 prepilin peptidase [Clostridium sp. SHJSY1]